METNNSEFMVYLELSSPISLMCFQTFDGKGRNDDALMDVCMQTHLFTHQMGRVAASGAGPREKPAMTSRASAGVGPGQEVSHRKLGEARLCHALTGCGRAESRGNEGEVHLSRAVWGPLVV